MTPTGRPQLRRSRYAPAVVAVAAPALMLLCTPAATADAQPPAPRPVAVVHDLAAQNVMVPISNFAFSPSSVSVRAGQTVTWVNQDSATHDVTSTGGPAQFASGPLAQGQSFSQTFSAPGTYSYFCSIHPQMTGTVTVG